MPIGPTGMPAPRCASVRKDVSLQIDFHLWWATFPNLLPLRDRNLESCATLEWFYWLGLRDFFAALLAGAPGIVVPEILHRLTKMLDDIRTIEVDILYQRSAIITIENDMFML